MSDTLIFIFAAIAVVFILYKQLRVLFHRTPVSFWFIARVPADNLSVVDITGPFVSSKQAVFKLQSSEYNMDRAFLYEFPSKTIPEALTLIQKGAKPTQEFLPIDNPSLN